MSEVRVKRYQCWESSLSFFLGKTPAVTMECGACSHVFKQRFDTISCQRKELPRALCPRCHTVNIVPIRVT